MAILASEKVLTLDYWKLAHNLKVGDYIFNSEGEIVQITVIQQYHSEECYKVVFDDQLSIRGDRNLGFMTENTKYRIQTYRKGVFRRPLKEMKASDLIKANLRNRNNRFAYSVPTTKPINLPEQTLSVPPFVFGFWYFNRRSNKRLAAPKGYGPEVYLQLKDHGYKVTEHRKVTTGEMEFSVYPKIESHLIPNLPTKIPNNYLLASYEQRLELLRGILHSKSRTYSKTKDIFRFSSVHYPTILQVQGLIESLGHKTTVTFDEKFKFYSILFKSKLKLVDNQDPPPIRVHHRRRFIRKIEPIQGQLCVHIETNGKNNSFLVGEGFIACH